MMTDSYKARTNLQLEGGTVGALVSSLIFMVIYSILYPGQDYPVLSDFETFGSLTGGIWFFILGAVFGIFSIIATMITEATRE